MDVPGIEGEPHRIRMAIGLEAVDAEGKPTSGRCRPVEMSHIAKVLHYLDKECAGAAPEIAYLQMLGTQAKG
jgi:hypothetical protein